MGTQHMRSKQPLPAGVKFFPEYLRAAGYFTTNNAKTDYNTSSSWDAAWNENNKTAHCYFHLLVTPIVLCASSTLRFIWPVIMWKYITKSDARL